MAHFAKYTAAAAGHLSKHYERAKDKNGDYIKFGNKDIDPDRTPENYNLAPDREGGGSWRLSSRGFQRSSCKKEMM